MPKEFSAAPDQIVTMIDQLLQKNYAKLVKANLKVGAVVVSTYEDDQLVAGLKAKGMNCAAYITKVSAKNRMYIPFDAQIFIDGFWLDQHPEDDERLALLDHELYHIKPKEKDGKIVVDEDGRMKFKMQPDEIYFTGFSAIIRRHGMAAGEAQEALEVHRIATENLELHKQGPAVEPDAEVTFTVVEGDEAAGEATPEAAAA